MRRFLNLGETLRNAVGRRKSTVRGMEIASSVQAVVEELEGRQMLSVPNGPLNPAAGASPTGINVTWTDNSWDEQGFIVERRIWGGAYSQVGVVGMNGTSFWDASVSANTQYTYRVSSFNSSGSSWAYETNSVTTGWIVNSTPTPVTPAPAPVTSSGLPTAPSNLSASATSSTSIALNWTSNSGGQEAGFKIERRTWGGAYACIATVGAGVTSFTDTAYSGGVSQSTQYTYRVRAYNWQGDSDYSNESSATTPANGGAVVTPTPTPAPAVLPPVTASGLPTAPSGLTATPTSSTSILLNWTSNTGGQEVGFKIERSVWGGGFVCIATVGQGVTSFTDTAYSGGVTPSTQYAYRVRAYNWQGDSDYSNTSAATTPANGAPVPAPTPTPTPAPAPVTSSGLPAAPSGLTSSATSSTTIALSWTSNSGGQELGFKIERGTWGGAFACIATVGQGVTSYTDNAYSGGVTAGTQYTYRVRAYNWQGDGAYSNTSTSTPGTGTPAVVYPPPSTTWNPAETTGYFTIGVYRQPVQTLATWKARGVNTAVFFYPNNPDWMTQYIQTAVSLGIWQIRDPQANISADVNAPYLLAYSHDDEPDINGIPTSQLAAEYATWKAANPNVPILVNVSGADTLNTGAPASRDAKYRGIFATADWVTSDTYPISAWGHPQWTDKASVLVNNGTDPYFSSVPFNDGTAVDKIRQLSGGKKQFTYIETSFQNNTAATSVGSRAPTADEFRGESWDAIIHGSKGLIYFPQQFNPDVTDATPPAVVAEMTKNDALITSFGAVLNSGSDANNNYVNLPGGLEATWRDFGGHRYYFVLNDSHGATYQTINLPGLSAGSVEVAGEGRSVWSSGGALTDSFGAYQLHVYRV